MKTRLLSVLLALLMVVPLAVSCAKEETGKDGGSDEEKAKQEENSGEEAPAETEPDPLAGYNFDGAVYKIMTSDTDISSNSMIQGSGELNGDYVNDAVFYRNLAAEDAMKVKFEYEQTSNAWDSVYTAVKTFIMSGDESVSLIIDDQRGLSNAAVEKLMYDASELSVLDFDNDYWRKDYMLNLSIDYKSVYLLVGDYFMNVLDRSQALLYNRNLYRDIFGDPDDIYKLVSDGKWTYDEMLPLMEGAYIDANGDDQADADDTYGLIIGGIGGSVFPFAYGSDIPFVSRGEDGFPTITMYCDRLISLYDKIYAMFYSSGTRTNYVENGSDLHTKFISGGALFISGCGLGDVAKFRDMEAEVGIIPNPKLDEQQDAYRTVVWDTAEIGAIPVTVGEPEMAGAVLQFLCRETHEKVLPMYYETALKIKYTRDNYAAGMIDLIHDGVIDMFCLVYGGTYANDIFTWTILGPLQRKESSISSEYEKREKAAVKSLERLIEVYQSSNPPAEVVG